MGVFGLIKQLTLRSIEKGDWAGCVAQCLPLSGCVQDIYYEWQYIALYEKPGSEARAFVYTDGDFGFFIPMLVAKVNIELAISERQYYDFETPYGYGGPIANTNNQLFLRDAWIAFNRYCDENLIIAGLIRYDPFSVDQESYLPETIDRLYMRDVVTLDLTNSMEEIWSGFSSSNRNKINKARKNGVQVVRDCSLKALSVFSELYVESMRRVQADDFYLFNEEYFLDIGRNLSGRYVLYLAYLESDVIGGALVLSSNSVIGYHLSAVKTDYRKLGVANYLRYEVIRDNLGSAMKSINFGGGLSDNPDDPLLKFKKGFSSKVLPFCIGKYTAAGTLYSEVTDLWSAMYPELTENYKNYHLKYRYRS